MLGTGKPIREFLYADDLAEAIILVLNKEKQKLFKACNNNFPIINVGSGSSVSIKSLSKIISKLSNYRGKIIFDKDYPDGTMKKNLNSKIIRSLGWKPKISLIEGLKKSIEFYLKNK